MPPPEPTQPNSWMRFPLASEIRDVPPTAVVNSPDAGQLVPGNELGTPVAAMKAQPSPLSPEEANRDWPCMAPSCRTWSVLIIDPSRYGKMSQPPMLADMATALSCDTNV